MIKENALESSDNPFSLAVISGIYAIEASSDDDRKYSFKIKLLRNLIHKKWGSQKIYALFCFFDGLLRLSEEKEMEFKNELTRYVPFALFHQREFSGGIRAINNSAEIQPKYTE